MRGLRWSWRSARRVVAASLLGWAAAGCSLDSLLKSDEVPPDVTNPAITKTHDGALTAYRGVQLLFLNGFGYGQGGGRPGGAVVSGALLSDELHWAFAGGSGIASNPLDQRNLPEGASSENTTLYSYGRLQQVRGQADQAIGLLTSYAPEQRALIGHSYALKAYAEVLLAELYCSGIPLSTLDFDGNYTLQPGSPTAAVFQYAVAAFDTALTLMGDNAQFVHLAAVGKARALLGLGDYAAAAAAAAAVPDDYQYALHYMHYNNQNASPSPSPTDPNLLAFNFLGLFDYTVADEEGVNGLNYVGSHDPRIPVAFQGTGVYGGPVYFPTNYAADGSSPLVLASGVEARLIEAERALHDGDVPTWLTKLNALRTDGTFATQPTADQTDDPAALDTLWHAGTGGVDSLRPLADPNSADGRVDLLFRERAFWLFLTGHRQGDLRRLIRQYGRTQDQVYPIGPYPSRTPGFRYEGDVTLPIPGSERLANPQFTGCISRTA